MNIVYTYFKKLPALYFTGLFLLYSGCFHDNDKDAARKLTSDLVRIDQYLAEHNIAALQDPTGKVRYVIHEAGTGAQPADTSCIKIRYKGKYLDDGKVFTNSDHSSYPMAGDLIEGWKLGMPQLHEGDSATLYIPSGLAYGPTGIPVQGIPPDAIVYFELKLLHVGEKYSPTPTPIGNCQ